MIEPVAFTGLAFLRWSRVIDPVAEVPPAVIKELWGVDSRDHRVLRLLSVPLMEVPDLDVIVRWSWRDVPQSPPHDHWTMRWTRVPAAG